MNRRTALKALLAAGALPLAGCAGEASTAQPGVLNIGQISNSVAFLPLFIAETNGYFAAERLTLGERPRLGTGAKVAAALKSGSIDLGAGVITDAFNLFDTDDGTRLVSSLVTEYYVDIVVPTSFQGPGTDAPIADRITALAGKKIGITGPGSGTEALVTYLFHSIGRNASTDSTLVNLGSAATAAIGALSSGQVDALAFFQPIGQQAKAAGAGRIYISPARGDVPSLRGALHGVLFSTRELMANKKDELAAFQRALARALTDIHGDPARVRALLGEYLKDIQPGALDALVPILPAEVPPEPSIRREGYDIALEFHQTSGLLKKIPDYTTLTAT